MPRKVTRGRDAPEGGVTAAMAGTGWVFGYGMVTPVFSARTGAAWLRRVPLRRQGRAPERWFVCWVPSSPSGIGASS
ncbi:hypothetical protein Van01_45900 [Micromonospora andamanensis]|uniref:Uncharacterized protein n=1 Tax=Micromonospora andamanensis TaxID=1287068 RepID=A0ABQ4I0R3_9ACTN|nr:hypothetical protein Van01_45900 [Micromonospora andamanensis]